MSKITKKGNHIFVPDHVTIPYIEGDGVGHEITPVSQKDSKRCHQASLQRNPFH